MSFEINIIVVPYSSEFKSLWDNFNNNAKNGLFMFSRDFMEYHKDRFNDCSLLFFIDEVKNENLLAILPANLADSTLYSHQGLSFGGFIISHKCRAWQMLELFNSLIAFMKERGIENLIYKVTPFIYHQMSAQEDIYALFRNNAKLYRIDLSSIIFLENKISFSKGRKSKINHAKKCDIKLIKSSDFAGFHKLLSEVLARHNAKPVHSVCELEFLANNFNNNIELYLALKNDEILAGSLLFIYPHAIHTQYLASSNNGREMGALDYLIAHLIEKYGNKKFFSFGISNENNGKFLNLGLIEQKERFGARGMAHLFFSLNIKRGGAQDRIPLLTPRQRFAA